MESNLLFEMLSKSARRAIFDSLAPQKVSSGSDIIQQGDEGTKFYILQDGSCDVFISKAEWGPLPRRVHSYVSGRYTADHTVLHSWELSPVRNRMA